MSLRNAHPVNVFARGLSDGYEQTNTFDGACRRLQNFIFDQSNPSVAVARPGCPVLVDFSTDPLWNSPTWCSVYITIGTRIYGMVATAAFPGQDEPFCYDTQASAFIPITGGTALNLPATVASAGAWNPPTMAQVGPYILLTHPGFDGAGVRFFGFIDISAPATPVYDCGNTATNPLVAVPIAVANYFNRAYFALLNATQYSDLLDPLTITNAAQTITYGDSTPVSALAPLAIGTSTQGVLAALIVFKASVESVAGSKMSTWQVTGDDALGNLALNQLSDNVGTFSPRSCCNTPEGLKFIAADGAYVINLGGQIVPLTSQRGNPDALPDIRAPFSEASPAQHSRAAAAYNAGLYRICLDTTLNGIAMTGLDFWFDERMRRWNGPHTFRYDCATALGKQFVISSPDLGAVLFLSSPVQQSAQSIYLDDGLPYDCILQYALMVDQGDMAANALVESTVELGRSSQASLYTITAQDEFGVTLDTAIISIANVGPLWGTSVWLTFLWAASSYVSQMLNIPWTQPLIFKRLQLQFQATAQGGVAVGRTQMRYQQLGYMNTVL